MNWKSSPFSRFLKSIPPIFWALWWARWAARRASWWIQERVGRHPLRVQDEFRHLRRMEWDVPLLPEAERGEGGRGGRASPRILFFSLRGWSTHLAWEATIAHALRLRGAEPMFVLCDRILPLCDAKTWHDPSTFLCQYCAWYSHTFLRDAQLPFHDLSEFITPDERQAALERIESLPSTELRGFTPAGRPLGEMVGASVARFLHKSIDMESTEDVRVYRGFLAAGLMGLSLVPRLLEALKPDTVFMLNGRFFLEAIMLAEAKRRGLNVWTYERGRETDSLLFVPGEPMVGSDYRWIWDEYKDRTLTVEEEERLDAILHMRASGKVGIEQLWEKKVALPGPVGAQSRTGGGATDARPQAALFTNVLWDTAMYRSDIGFASMEEWLVETVRYFAQRPDWRLVVRAHPAEVRIPHQVSRERADAMVRAAFPQLPPNVTLIGPEEPVDSYALLDASDLVLAYASTIGLEAATRGLPVVLAGKSHYRDKGFTQDVASKEEYFAALDAARPGDRLTADQFSLSRRYAFLYFHRLTIPMDDLLVEWPRATATFRYSSIADLAPGRHPNLDTVCEGLLRNRIILRQ